MTTAVKNRKAAVAALTEAANSFTRAVEQLTMLLSEEASPPSASTLTLGKTYSRIATDTPREERALRQALIVKEILDRGGSVPKTEWYDIAAQFGYEGRGLAGFFRKTGKGLLVLRGNQVTVTAHGKRRLREYATEVRIEEAANRVAGVLNQ